MGAQVGIYGNFGPGGVVVYSQDEYYTPEMFGAVGGGSDDTIPIQAAFNAAIIGKRKVVFTAGKNYGCRSVTIPYNTGGADSGPLEIDGSQCVITAIGNPLQVFLIDTTGGVWHHHIKLHGFQFWGDSTNRIRIVGGSLYNSKIYDIYSRSGTVADAIIKFYQNSNTASCGLNHIYNIHGGGDDVSGFHMFAVHFTKNNPANMGWDTTDFDDIGLSTSVVGSGTIREDGVGYVSLCRFNKIFFGSTGGDVSFHDVINGWFVKCEFSNVYGEFLGNVCYAIQGFFTECGFKGIDVYSAVAPCVQARIAVGNFVGCDFQDIGIIDSAGNMPYSGGAYQIINDVAGSVGCRLSFRHDYLNNIMAGFTSPDWMFNGDKYPFLTDYANDAAAGVGGLITGQLYAVTGSNPKQVAVKL